MLTIIKVKEGFAISGGRWMKYVHRENDLNTATSWFGNWQSLAHSLSNTLKNLFDITFEYNKNLIRTSIKSKYCNILCVLLIIHEHQGICEQSTLVLST